MLKGEDVLKNLTGSFRVKKLREVVSCCTMIYVEEERRVYSVVKSSLKVQFRSN